MKIKTNGFENKKTNGFNKTKPNVNVNVLKLLEVLILTT